MSLNENTIPVKRDDKGRYIKGTPNPNSGRKKIPEAIREILEIGTVDAAKFLVETIQNPDEKTEHRIRASEIVMDRLLGKVKQQIDATIESNLTTQVDLSGLTVEQLLKITELKPENGIIDAEYTPIIGNSSEE